jgi:hypothetical protein
VANRQNNSNVKFKGFLKISMSSASAPEGFAAVRQVISKSGPIGNTVDNVKKSGYLLQVVETSYIEKLGKYLDKTIGKGQYILEKLGDDSTDMALSVKRFFDEMDNLKY